MGDIVFVTSNPKHDRYKKGLAFRVNNVFDKVSTDTTTHTGTEIVSEKHQIAYELHRFIT